LSKAKSAGLGNMNLQEECTLLLERFGVPAVGLARIGASGVESLGCLGERKAKSSVAVTENDLWHIGSCAKSMTATVMARLVERGLLEWDAPIAPLYAARGIEVHPDFAALTLRHLLTHTSGMPADPTPSELEQSYYATTSPRLQRAALAESALMAGPELAPGEPSGYSNLAFTTAGALAEAVTGLAWEEVVRRELFAPLKLASAGFGPPGKGLADELAQPWGHEASFRGFSACRPDDMADNPPLIAPAGTIHMSLPDFARYVAVHVSSGATAPSYLSAETVDFLHAPFTGEDGAFGWFLLQPEENGIGLPILWHDGSNKLWYAAMFMVPDERRALAFVCNAYHDRLVDPQNGVIATLEELYVNWAGAIA
jgi:CubicO group peptidase (beta-lactamase class C family)